MKNMTSRRLLQRAADDIQKNGLFKGEFFKDTKNCSGPACVTGALIRAKYGYVAKKNGKKMEPVSDENDSRFSNAIVKGAINLLTSVVKIPKTTPWGGLNDVVGDLMQWNDKERRRKSDVVNALRKAARS